MIVKTVVAAKARTESGRLAPDTAALALGKTLLTAAMASNCIPPTLVPVQLVYDQSSPPETSTQPARRQSGISQGSELAGEYGRFLLPAIQTMAPQLGCPWKEVGDCANAGNYNIEL